MADRRQQFGKESESVAATRLIKMGYTILERNFRTNRGEIDIIAKEGDTIVFVEVKARKSDRFGSPKAAVTFKKQKKMSVTALSYLKATKQTHVKARFDVVAISVSASGPESDIEIIRNAFEFML